ncbi:uncharacterized protein Triagg1_1492 [Trichoderma aggressivum f. europaeum]|uniref:NWD NACHT-NTPase N-terminal domain-containing protein n=1 Tax=Trichoderma aggressivum f. europaeum TaxID=173218 RepID=A0AAE1M986_9HYPO|nr:hypothetical protein Triagg1_1492 [Trichoderma aggressivum f. europaeum]
MSIAVKVSIILSLCLRGHEFKHHQAAAKTSTFLPPSLFAIADDPDTVIHDGNMGAKTWLQKHSLWPSRSSSSVSTRQPDAVDSAHAQNDQRHLKEPVANAAPNANASTVPQAKANKTTEQSEATCIPSSVTSATFDDTPIRELWNVAYEKLREGEGALVAEYEARLQGSVVAGLGEGLKPKSNTRERMWAILQSKMNEVNQNTTKFNIGSTEVKMRDVAQLVLNVVGAANRYISQAVSANPSASIAWVGISVLLPLFTNISTESAVQAKGLEYIASLISQSQMREELYIKCYESRKETQQEFQQSHREYKAALERLYRQILKFQAKSCYHFSNSSVFRYGLDAVKWNDWDQLVNDVRQRDTEFAAFEQIWRDLQHFEERLAAESLQRETIDSMAAIRGEMSISREAAERAMTKQERYELFDWLCDIDPSSIYNTARERHEPGTNEWLVQSKEFQTWERSDGSLLWLHGKAGSGKSIISSSVISYLKDKYASRPSTALAYFYFSFSDVKKQQVDGMLASLIKQILTEKFELWPVDIKEEVGQSLIEKADSMFQYVRFQLEILQELSSASEIRKALLDLPIGLDATYDRILQNIDTKFQRRVINSLKWLAFSKSLLTIEELAEIFIIDPDKDIAFDEGTRLFSSLAILKYFSGLVVNEKETNTVRLVHFSIKEYLTSDRIEERLTSAFSFTEADAHMHIARSCLSYAAHLSTTAKKKTQTTLRDLRKTHHLIDYATSAWADHLEEVPRVQWPDKVIITAVLALTDQSPGSFAPLMMGRITVRENLEHLLKRPHCYTAYSGFRQLTEAMIAEKHGTHEYITQEDLDFGLHYAAYGGHLDIVQLFLEKGANMKAHCGKWASAVHAAVGGEHINVLDFFVRNGWADVNCQPALFVCIFEWDTQTLGYLLDQGMNMDTQDEQHGTALHKAIINGNSTDFELLLERGVDINALNEELGTPLQAACERLCYHDDRNLRYIEKLLDCGADPNIRGGECGTALQAACSTELISKTEVRIEAVRLLLEHGADVNAQGGFWGSSLHAAAASMYSEENVELMKLLLDNGAKVNQTSGSWGTALHVACYHGTIEAARFLVDRGADVNAESDRFGTPILAAAARGQYNEDFPRLPFFTLLMDKGANVNHRGGEYGSALQAHFHEEANEIESLHFLLKHCSDVNAEGGKYGTALIAACTGYSRREDCVQMLLDLGAHVNTQSEEYGTALIAACDRGEKDTRIVQRLLECGADVNAKGGEHGTALIAACSWNYSEAVELLLNHGANLHLQDCAAWHSAIRGIATHESPLPTSDRADDLMLEHFLNRNMDINHEHPEYGTALHAMMNAEGRAGPEWRQGIRMLLKHHINPNIMSERLGSALHIACAIKHAHDYFDSHCKECWNLDNSSSKAAYLLEQCPNINVNAQGGTFGTALQAAAYSGQIISVRMLLDRKADINACSGKYHSALNGAIISGHWNIVKVLLAAGATPDCHLQEEPDEAWLRTILEEDGRGAVERYRKFWKVELGRKTGGEGASNS